MVPTGEMSKTEVIEEEPVSLLDRIRYGQMATETGFFLKNLKNGGLRKALSVLIYNTRWRVGYAIGPFHHACGEADCSGCLD